MVTPNPIVSTSFFYIQKLYTGSVNNKILNFVIAVSILGIIIAISRDYLFKRSVQQVAQKDQTVIPTLISTPAVAQLGTVPCKNSFFVFKKGTTWRYKILNGTKESFLTSETIASTSSSITLQTTFEDTKEKSTSTILCKEDGVYGLPFPIVSFLTQDKTSGLGGLAQYIKIDNNLKLLPEEKLLTSNGTWKTPIPISVSLPIKLPISVNLNNNVSGILTKSILNKTNLREITVQSTLDLSGLQGMGIANQNPTGTKATPANILEYKIAEGIGITELKILMEPPIVITLVSFK